MNFDAFANEPFILASFLFFAVLTLAALWYALLAGKRKDSAALSPPPEAPRRLDSVQRQICPVCHGSGRAFSSATGAIVEANSRCPNCGGKRFAEI